MGGETYPNKNCKNCIFRKQKAPKIGMLITAYEVKITKADFLSENGHSIDDKETPFANLNYYCVPKELVEEIRALVSEHCGILTYYGNGVMREAKRAQRLEVDEKVKTKMLYNALKKWCDGAMAK